jgi:hypothetical protein
MTTGRRYSEAWSGRKAPRRAGGGGEDGRRAVFAILPTMHKVGGGARLRQGSRRWIWMGATAALGCGGSRSRPPEIPTSAFAGLAAVPVLVTPTQRARVALELQWTAAPVGAELAARMDADILAALRARDIGRTWVFGEALQRSYSRNPTYATNPTALAIESLRSGRIQPGTRLPEPLASQLRTMIALHDGRVVVIPVELRIDTVAAGQGRGVLRVVLVDARTSDVRWAGELAGDPVSGFGPQVTATVAARFVTLFATP